MEIVVFLFALIGFMLIFNVPMPALNLRTGATAAGGKIKNLVPKRPETAKEYVAKINGRTRQNLLKQSRDEAKSVFAKTGQSKGYRKTVYLSCVTVAGGVMVGVLFGNLFLSLILGVGLYFIPLWMTRFALYRYNKFYNDEMEVALSLITTSYSRKNDILGAVEENLAHISSPVKEVFVSFVNNVKYVDANVPAQIERMKLTTDNKLFHKWCDSLMLCQHDHTLIATLTPIVNSFADLKGQQMANETNMMKPLRQAIFMTGLTVSVIPLFRLLNVDWYMNLVDTVPGKAALIVTAVTALFTINKAIRLSKPIEYDV